MSLECIICGSPITIHDEIYDGKCAKCRNTKRTVKYQRLKLKRIKNKRDLPEKPLLVKSFVLNKQSFQLLVGLENRIYIKNQDNDKFYELINEVLE